MYKFGQNVLFVSRLFCSILHTWGSYIFRVAILYIPGCIVFHCMTITTVYLAIFHIGRNLNCYYDWYTCDSFLFSIYLNKNYWITGSILVDSQVFQFGYTNLLPTSRCVWVVVVTHLLQDLVLSVCQFQSFWWFCRVITLSF